MIDSERRTTSVAKKLITLIISLIILFFQIGFLYIVFFGIQKYHIAYLLVETIGVICVIRIYSKMMNSSYKMMWIIFILVFPFAGTMFYLLYGNSRGIPVKKNKKILKYLEDKIPSLDNDALEDLKQKNLGLYKIPKYINSTTKFPLFQNTDITFYNDISLKHKALLEKLDQAKKFIFIEYFIVADGQVLEDIIKVLTKKGQEGVEIKFCYDDIGSNSVLKKKTIDKIKMIPNTKIVAYEPLGININPAINFRDHRKIVVIDGNYAFVGGDNLADEYVHLKQRFGYWRDNCILLEGEAVISFTVLFAEIWYMSTKETLDITNYKGDIKTSNKSYVMPFGDGPSNKKHIAYDVLRLLITSAKKNLYISTPYFIIDKDFISLIGLACSCGVDVKILVPSIPDKKGVFMMSRAHYGDVLKSGGKIYEFTPGFNHAKNIIIDDIAFIGTVNIDYRSLFLHFETGAIIIKDKVINEMRKDFLDAISKSEEITLEKWKKRTIFSRILSTILNILSPLL